MGPSTRAGLDPELDRAIAASNLAALPDDALLEFTRGARRVAIDAGDTIHREGDDDPHVELVVSGLVRVFVSASDGRTMTIRYCRRGALIGVATVFGQPEPRSFAVQALTVSDLLRLRPDCVRDIVDRDARATKAMLREMSERVMAFTAELSGSTFATVRERLARHLLDLASEQQRGEELIARVTQQELADAVGTVREVIVRELRGLRADGIVETRRDGIAIVDPEGLVPAPDQRRTETAQGNTRS
jgi:CRP/FNR family cyclic AMP-dependent transcriptional regulator